MIKTISISVLLLCAISAIAQTPTAKQLFQQAVEAQQRGDDVAAVRIYRELLQSHPEVVLARANLGASLANLKRFDEAIEEYQAALLTDPHNLPVRLNLALAYEEKGDFPHEVTQLEFFHSSEAGNLQASMLLADCYFRLDRYIDTVKLLEPLERFLPNDLDLAWLLGSALINTGRAEEGLRRIDKVAEKAQNAEAYLLAAQTRLTLTQYDLAEHDGEADKRLNTTM